MPVYPPRVKTRGQNRACLSVRSGDASALSPKGLFLIVSESTFHNRPGWFTRFQPTGLMTIADCRQNKKGSHILTERFNARASRGLRASNRRRTSGGGQQATSGSESCRAVMTMYFPMNLRQSRARRWSTADDPTSRFNIQNRP
jgi:hypothetical protein